jgi:hypothetical protein
MNRGRERSPLGYPEIETINFSVPTEINRN